MASNINSTNINGSYPVAGISNDSQGFRNNFTNIKNNFDVAANEISDLQSKVILKSSLAGQDINNDMTGASISNATLTGVGLTISDAGTTIGTVILDYSQGNVQKIVTSGAITVGFSNWPIEGIYGSLLLWLEITDTTHTIALSNTSPGVTLGLSNISTVPNLGDGVIGFATTGTYLLSFSTVDAGQNILINDLTRNFNNTQSVFQLAELTNTQINEITPNPGMIVYNSTYGNVQAYSDHFGGWGNITLS